MDEILATLAFALLIGGQFLAAIVLISRRRTIYADPGEHVPVQEPQPNQADHQIAESGRTAEAA